MNQYQLEDILTSTSLASVEAFGMYVTLLAAYLVASFAAGEKLSKGQAVTVSVLFIVAALVMTWTTYGFLSRSIPLAAELAAMNPDRLYGARPALRTIVAIIQILGIFSSLLFMRSIRCSRRGDI
ncbi:MAG: hypothetical protein AB8B86_15225 [Pseudomonadales bacterium]